MTSDELYEFLYDWVNKVINVDPETPPSPAIPIVASYDNGPPPKVKYISINPDTNQNKNGRASAGDVNTGTLKRTLVNDYEMTVEIREVGGGNDLLRLLIDSIERQEIIDLFTANDLVYYGEGPITIAPTLQQSVWRQESFVELRLGKAEGTVEESSYIESVETSGTIPAQGRSGDHSV